MTAKQLLTDSMSLANVRVEYEQDGVDYVYITQGVVTLESNPRYEEIYPDYGMVSHQYMSEMNMTMTVQVYPDAEGKYGYLKRSKTKPKGGYRSKLGEQTRTD